MSDRQMVVDRYEGWDEEKAASFERITCPVCGYRAVFYDDGDVVVERERDPQCTCCAEFDDRDVVVPYDYGTSTRDGGSSDEGLGCVGCFMALLIVPIIAVLFMVNVLGWFH